MPVALLVQLAVRFRKPLALLGAMTLGVCMAPLLFLGSAMCALSLQHTCTDRHAAAALPIPMQTPAPALASSPNPSDQSSTPNGLHALCSTLSAVAQFPVVSQLQAPDARARAAIAFAVEQLGKPYVADGMARPPWTWDCSTLTAAAWGAAGVHLTAYSYSQWDEVQHIAQSDVQPGDLVFWFAGGVHHVAIVDSVTGPAITFVQAANPSQGVVQSTLTPGWYTAHLSGFGRVIRPPEKLPS